ncbi:glycosyltransferase [Wenzhouxiangella sp. XN201]|uniref:glycosyltransferase family 2 protein n=1 Tax=Wenzhouxiangella sp. XN201 TaxID=2710755 RepID=UPI0013CD75F4|nr:glycosyltransferase [Wenzhouxiangella sp. XN201]NEZ03433.1 glycosyltransferase [Wenzhouxiangella sp. XN201]
MAKNTIGAAMKGRTPTVSILCHTYNHEPFIGQALESMLIQKTDFPVEVIVHDDASTDGTAAAVRDLAIKHSGQIHPILQETNQFKRDMRPSRFTFPHANGEFIALCEGDDYWCCPYKLQRQVDALRRYPEVDLCVHSALRLSVRSGKQKRHFYYGPKERIVQPETIIARHNQFAPTASMLMRANAAQSLPDWFFNDPGLPVGDFFIEAILGRKGVLYLPDAMSVYRRDVPGSYTNSFRNSRGEALEERLKRMLYFVEKLRGMKGIPERALDQRLSYVRLNYALQFLSTGDRDRFIRTSRNVRLEGHSGLQAALSAMRRSRMAFEVGRRTFQVHRYFKD